MNEQSHTFLSTLAVDIASVGKDAGFDIKIMSLPGALWINWKDNRSQYSGTAEIDDMIVVEMNDTPRECAESFVNFLCDFRSEVGGVNVVA